MPCKKSEKTKKQKDPIQEAVDFGIDVSLLYKKLKLAPTERLKQNLNYTKFAEELRKAGSKKFVKS